METKYNVTTGQVEILITINGGSSFGKATTSKHTATGNQTVFIHGSDFVTFPSVWVNKSQLAPSDYTHDENTVTLKNAVFAGDIVEILG